MKIICPVCCSKYDLEEATKEKLHRDMVALAAKFGRSWELVSEYLDCFRQSPWGCITLKRRVALLKEVWKLFEKAEFEYKGKKYRTDRARILEAMNKTVTTQPFKFKNHNYLKSVLVGDAEKLSGEGLTAKEETRREEKRRDPASPPILRRPTTSSTRSCKTTARRRSTSAATSAPSSSMPGRLP